jgi:hypothetical protein
MSNKKLALFTLISNGKRISPSSGNIYFGLSFYF